MSYVMKTKLANKSNYGGSRSLDEIKWIVIHYTSNDGDTDENNGIYFADNIVKASAHYFVDDDSVTVSVPDNYIAWSVGGSKYYNCNQTGGGKYHGKCTNANSLSIEICDDVRNGVVYPSAKTIENAIELTKQLMKKYGIPLSNVIRHFDVTGKSCPAYWCGSDEKNEKWKKEFYNKLTGSETPVEMYRVRKSWEDAKSQKGAFKNLEYAKECADEYEGYKVYDSSGKVVYKGKQTDKVPFKVRVGIDDLNIRTGAGTGYSRVQYIDRGVYTITEVKNGAGSDSGWGKLKSGAGWISLDYVERV